MSIKVGSFRIYTEVRNGVEQAVCPNCGVALSFRDLQKVMPAAETGYFYCSKECALEHVIEERKAENEEEREVENEEEWGVSETVIRAIKAREDKRQREIAEAEQ